MRIKASAYLDTTLFSAWIQHGGAPLPAVLGAGHIANADVDLEDLAREMTRQESAPTTWVNPIEQRLDRQTREVLATLSRVLADPSHGVLMPWGLTDGGILNNIAGFVRRHDAVILTDNPDRVVINVVDPVDLAQAAASQLPVMPAYTMQPLTLSQESLAHLQTLGPTPQRDHLDRVAARYRLPPDDLWAAVRLTATSHTSGTIGACAFVEGQVSSDLFGCNWFHSQAGALLQRRTAGGWVIEPATGAALARTTAQCLDALPHPTATHRRTG